MALLRPGKPFYRGNGPFEMYQFPRGLLPDQMSKRCEVGLAAGFKKRRPDVIFELAQHH